MAAGALVDAIERLVRVGVAVTTRALAEEPGAELTVQQWRVLVLVASGPPLRVGAVAERIGASHPSASRLVGRLESAGLVQQDPDPGDRRASRVRATDEGRRVVASVLDRRRALIADGLAHVDPPADAVVREIERVCDALDHLA